jgi:flagellar M-ring protein FliF
MDVFIAELKKIWQDLSLSQRFVIGLATIAIVLFMSFVFMWSAKPDMQMLYGRLGPKDMSEVISTIEQMNIPYKIEGGGASVFVPSDKVYALRMQLASKGVPSGEGVGFEIFDQNNFGISDFVQRTNYTRALQGELARTIIQLKHVRTARVMIVVPENRLLAESKKISATASVFVDTGGLKINEEAVNSIRFLVANAVQGLSVEDVAVVDNNGNVLSENLKGDPGASGLSSQIRYRQSIEEYYSKKIEDMLSKIAGAGNIVAKVAVDIDSDASKVTEERFDPEGQVIRTQTLTEDVNSTKENKPSQIVSLQGAGAAGSPRDEGGSVNVTEASKKNKNVSYEISRSTTEMVKSPGAIKDISAAVFIAKRYKEEGGKRTELPRSEGDIKTLQKMVANILGIKESGLDRISIQEADFNNEYKAFEVSWLDTGEKIMDLSKPLIASVFALIIFFVFLRMLKKYKPELKTTNAKNDYALGALQAMHHKPTPAILNQMIQQKPENVGEALKNWINANETK